MADGAISMGSVRVDIAERPAARKSVAVLVNNVCTYDSRVIKGAEELARRGYRVAIFAVKASDLPDIEVVRGVAYRRLARVPVALRNAAASRNPGGDGRRAGARLSESASDLQADLLECARLSLAFLLRERYAPVVAGRARIEAAIKARLKGLAMRLRGWASRANALMRLSGSTPKDLVVAAIQTGPSEKSDRALAMVQLVASRNLNAIEAFRPDIIHCHDVDCIVAASALSRSLNCPFIYDVHELCAHRWDRNDPEFRASIAEIEDQYIGEASGVITVSEELADDLR